MIEIASQQVERSRPCGAPSPPDLLKGVAAPLLSNEHVTKEEVETDSRFAFPCVRRLGRLPLRGSKTFRAECLPLQYKRQPHSAHCSLQLSQVTTHPCRRITRIPQRNATQASQPCLQSFQAMAQRIGSRPKVRATMPSSFNRSMRRRLVCFATPATNAAGSPQL